MHFQLVCVGIIPAAIKWNEERYPIKCSSVWNMFKTRYMKFDFETSTIFIKNEELTAQTCSATEFYYAPGYLAYMGNGVRWLHRTSGYEGEIKTPHFRFGSCIKDFVGNIVNWWMKNFRCTVPLSQITLASTVMAPL
jgi:hypothetical protein